MKIWIKKETKDFGASEWCRVCGRYDVNLTMFPYLMCDAGGEHAPVAMIRVHQQKGHRPKPNRLQRYS